ncbi:nuclear receptor ROR-alpha B-like isoform X2 [Mya arenaria]|nr:nuclear receptor ROR-alpha B-like isoform X2 [Mya arenaria]XP_052763163.1 nuclear receptor ROR-alpha B-like isoform X2 [Mya arenaria]
MSTKGQKAKTHYTTVEMAHCRVCGRKSSGYHFGVVSCEACKAFYRRAISQNSRISTVCRKGNNRCYGDVRSISDCSACRLNKCKDLGMSKRNVRKGRFSHALRTQSILAAQMEHDKDTENAEHGVEHQQYEPENNQTLELDCEDNRSNNITYQRETDSSSFHRHSNAIQSQPKDDIEEHKDMTTPTVKNVNHEDVTAASLYETTDSSDTSNRNKTSHDMIKMPQQSFSADDMCTDVPIDLSVRSPHVDVEDLEVCETIQRLVNLQDSLYPHAANDPSVLLELAIIEEEHRQREEVFKMMFGDTSEHSVSAKDFNIVYTETNMELDDRLKALRKKGIENEKNIVKYIQHSKHIPGFDTLELDDILNLLKDSYFEFWLFSNHAYFNDQVSGGSDAVVQAHKKVIMSLFPKDYVESVFKFAESLRSLELTLEEVAIIRGIILTFTDRQKLNHSHAVEKLQEKYVECLIHHLSTTRDQYLSRFCRIIDRLTEVRSLTYRNSFVNSQVLSDWPFIAKEFPLWKEIMSTHKD